MPKHKRGAKKIRKKNIVTAGEEKNNDERKKWKWKWKNKNHKKNKHKIRSRITIIF